MAGDQVVRITAAGFFFLLTITYAQITNFPWPLGDMVTQERISATFDECREDRDHFHNGTDIPLAPGGEVKSIMDGKVIGLGSDWIRVEDFAYVHVNYNPTLLIGSVVSRGDVVGWTDSYAHIHLNYGGGASGHPYCNPLKPGGLVPFEDTYHPRSPLINFVVDGTSETFPSNEISGRVDIIAQAADTTDLRSSIDMNNGIYTIGWALYSSDTSTVLQGPEFWFKADALYSDTYIKNVYAPGSSTSIYRYIVTNRISTNGYLDCSLYPTGPYVVAVMSSDTKDNWDTTYVPVTFTDTDLMPPEAPILSYVGADSSGGLRIEWMPSTSPDLAGYRLEYSFDGKNWTSNHGPDVLTAAITSFTVPNFSQNTYIMFRMLAEDTAPIPNRSEYSDTYGVQLNQENPKLLIVDGFDRISGSWNKNSHDFSTYYTDAVLQSRSEWSITSANNEWVVQEGSLNAYDIVLWFLGDEGRSDETFSSAEQSIISNYLEQGGEFFTSGSEIAYDLIDGSTDDIDFMNQILHIGYAGDDAGDFNVIGVDHFFSGISFSYGESPYEEDWPDYFSAENGGLVALQYGNGRIAAVRYQDENSHTFVMGFPFETISSEQSRVELMDRILTFFEASLSTSDKAIPMDFAIKPVYPNPFNSQVSMQYSIDQPGDYGIRIFDISGREVFNLPAEPYNPGTYSFTWGGRNNTGKSCPSGSYILQISDDKQRSLSVKLLILK